MQAGFTYMKAIGYVWAYNSSGEAVTPLICSLGNSSIACILLLRKRILLVFYPLSLNISAGDKDRMKGAK
jgi:hypothetical protein